jgi:hypothetical protein
LLLPGSGGALPKNRRSQLTALKDPRTFWIESLLDVNEPYLYVLVLATLALFALGFRSQAALFGLGAALFFTLANTLSQGSHASAPTEAGASWRDDRTKRSSFTDTKSLRCRK